MVVIIFTSSLNSFGQTWIGKIIPMKTNTSNLNQFFDVTPEKKYDDKLLLKLKEGNLFVWFSQGNCVSGSWGQWNVNKGIIIALTFYPKKRRKITDYEFSTEGMKESFDSGHQTYTNDEKGLYYSTQFGKVTRINYYPSREFESLRCKD
jgi:hypothetical protein